MVDPSVAHVLSGKGRNRELEATDACKILAQEVRCTEDWDVIIALVDTIKHIRLIVCELEQKSH